MSDVVIKVEKLSKKYILSHQSQERYTALRDVMANSVKNLGKKLLSPFTANSSQSSTLHNSQEDFYALRDVSFEIKQGDRVGIIGRNGAGKSTLLKILSRITEPTSGKIEITGRVASLLEVGTGFHPELTGRENIYLNGAILGMGKAEIKRKFDEIVDFAEVEKFLDTPVKRYSSGMYVRLAFAVAAHMEPEILIVDEVLAVGDAQFQKKCLGKMEDVSKQGKTLLFVSHNMAAIKGLCDYGLLLMQGKLQINSDIDTVVRNYLSEASQDSVNRKKLSYRHRGDKIQIIKVDLVADGHLVNSVQSGDSLSIKIYYEAINNIAIGSDLSISVLLFSEGLKLVNLWSNCYCSSLKILKSGIIECVIPNWPFRSHSIRVDIYSHIGHDVQDWVEDCLNFESFDGDYYSTGIITNSSEGILFLNHRWSSYANE